MHTDATAMGFNDLPSGWQPESRAALFGLLSLLTAYVFLGLIGHDPWKQDEAYSFGIIYNMYLSGDLVVPTLAGDPFMEKPPAYYITATGMVHLLSPWLELHDAARLTHRRDFFARLQVNRHAYPRS